jgi:hypothetical protein
MPTEPNGHRHRYGDHRAQIRSISPVQDGDHRNEMAAARRPVPA